jgi:site-specific recombinase XerC
MEDIDFETGTIMVCGKFEVERLAHVSPETIEVMRQYCQHERPQPVGPDKLLLNKDGTPMTGGRVQKVLERIGQEGCAQAEAVTPQAAPYQGRPVHKVRQQHQIPEEGTRPPPHLHHAGLSGCLR